MMHITLPAAFLRAIGNALHMQGSRAVWWHDHAAQLIAASGITGALLLATGAGVLVWTTRNRYARGHSEVAAGRLWAGLVFLILAIYGCTYVLLVPGPSARDAYRLKQIVTLQPEPVFADLYTAQVLDYLDGYSSRGARVLVREHALDDRTMQVVRGRRGCIVVDQPELDALTRGVNHSTVSAYTLLDRPPLGWTVVARSPSFTNPLESVGVLCAHRQKP